ncbi:glycoside hydrolase family 15 protein [Williamsia sterculiae]|uniref:Glucoamylase (Glucan-1,4-alpha-glucosidase), GH15 family n=1 Tax=Williamsia sterculiae TaxID=1344003 RepID=A0A1N7H5M3_9NOCA|nr:glycoside hydrolase family 15 protein [Williamsia sterculiae]SIS20149.1 Glucoamylase (glucan-1,4-alpha-glucosidase), GH15 family [Williamsia sterculiae]
MTSRRDADHVDTDSGAAETNSEPRYLPIADHGVIGDLRTAALVGTDGRIDWFCCPRFDSPSVFGSVLDADDGGAWTVRQLDGHITNRQFYLPDSNVLVTRFMSEDGVAEVQDLMPLTKSNDPDHHSRIVRRIECVRGHVRFRTELTPRFDYGRAQTTIEDRDERRVDLVSDDLTLHLRASVPLEQDSGVVWAEFTLDAGESATFVLSLDDLPDSEFEKDCAADGVHATVAFWQNWISQSNYTGRWRETVHRSALALKLLTHEPSGAVVAAVTCGLPEEVGGERNWDYRYVWIRDAAFSLYALLRLGFTAEASSFMDWLTCRFSGDGDEQAGGPLRLMYTIDGGAPPGEQVLDSWEGYRGSAPVRVGNDAGHQLQLDIYGELIDSVYLFNKYGPGISQHSWQQLCEVARWLLDNWDTPDQSIWEPRSSPQRYVYSRLMSWVALERMIRISRQRGLPGDVADWMRVRDEIFTQIMDHGWNAELQSFVQVLDGDQLDAALLLIPAVKLLSPSDELFTATLHAIEQNLVSDSLVFRYNTGDGDDGLNGSEGTFSLCSFWYVEALTRVGRLADARLALEKMFTYANHLGLYAEQIALTGEQLGNMPQAFTHLSLISAAINLDRRLGG